MSYNNGYEDSLESRDTQDMSQNFMQVVSVPTKTALSESDVRDVLNGVINVLRETIRLQNVAIEALNNALTAERSRNVNYIPNVYPTPAPNTVPLPWQPNDGNGTGVWPNQVPPKKWPIITCKQGTGVAGTYTGQGQKEYNSQ